jgi:hypothetical protein
VVLPNPGSHHRTPNESPDDGGWVARVERMDERRIDRVRLLPVTADVLRSRVHHVDEEQRMDQEHSRG